MVWSELPTLGSEVVKLKLPLSLFVEVLFSNTLIEPDVAGAAVLLPLGDTKS